MGRPKIEYKYQLTSWLDTRKELWFVTRDFKKHKVRHKVIRRGNKFAVFTEGKNIFKEAQIGQMDTNTYLVARKIVSWMKRITR